MKYIALLFIFFTSSANAQMNCLMGMLNQAFTADNSSAGFPSLLYEFSARKVPVVMRTVGLSATHVYIGFQGTFESKNGLYLIDESGRASFVEVAETDSFIYLSSAYSDSPVDSRLTVQIKDGQLSMQAGWNKKATRTNIIERTAVPVESDNPVFQLLLESLLDYALPDYIEACEINEFDESRDYKKPKLNSCLDALKICQDELNNADLDSWFDKIAKNQP